MHEAETPKRGRGRPRREEAGDSALETMKRLLLERRYEEITLDSIAKEAGTAKTSLYRRWASKGLLALSAIEAIANERVAPSAAPRSLRDELNAIIEEIRWLLSGPLAATIVSLLAESQHDSTLAERLDAMLRHEQRIASAIDEAQARGDEVEDLSAAGIADQIAGVLFTHHLIARRATPLPGDLASCILGDRRKTPLP